MFLETFRPLPLLSNGHVQTILGHLLRGRRFLHPTRKRRIALSDGDQMILHDSTPDSWQQGENIAVLVHGMGGCHDSGHIRRLARMLAEQGVRTVRLDLRGAGDGLCWARKGYHGGCSADVRAALAEIHCWSPTSPLVLIGISLGGNISLKLAGEAAAAPVPGLERVVAMGPPIDMESCSALISQRRNWFYQRYFTSLLMAQVHKRLRHFPDLLAIRFPRKMTLRLFDSLYTAPCHSFDGAEDYYQRSSSAPLIPLIRVPTLILTARDDPFIAVRPFEELSLPKNVELRIVDRGGHLGFLGWDGKGGIRWAERRVLEWCVARK